MERDAYVDKKQLKAILAAHQAEMDRVVEEVIGKDSLHAFIDINGDRCNGLKTENESDCDCPAGEENTLRMNQRARYKAIKEGK